ncbi:MAG: ATP-binding protein [Prolixibacteraceae bacterium]|nr:ATP-binding protein [Prolixibacteraceae bacterium]
MDSQLIKLIKQGEHQKQDFKYCITDSRKIAKSLVAFANTDGGSLLVGVKDNGNIVGVSSDEEYYMVEAAARMYSKPAILFTTRQFTENGKTVLQINVEPGNNKPYFAKNEDNRWIAYFRYKDENRLANKVMIDVWQREKKSNGVILTLGDSEFFLLNYLAENEFITVSRLARKACISYRKAEQLLADFIVLDIIRPRFEGDTILYTMNKDFDVSELTKGEEIGKQR